MIKKQLLTLILALLTFDIQAQTIEKPKSKDISMTIYNNDLALIRDIREVNFKKGINMISFEGVASNIKPESVMIEADDIRVLEQNYDYALLTAYNIAEKSVGQKIKTVRTNPQTGENIFDNATILSFQNGAPVLKFDYGIETNFDGRLVFENLPQNLNQKPTLAAKISSQKETLKDLMIAYLTNGLSWKTNYVADIKDEKMLDLTGWVSITNNSGISYQNASVQLIAGNVNEVKTYGIAPRNVMMLKTAALGVADMAVAENASVLPESFSAYQLYNLPNRTDIDDNQTKQLSLIEQFDVSYQKEGRINSGLYFNGDYASNFEKIHPDIYYIITNDKESNLGIALPQGIVRFYEKDSKGNLQFIGENSISQTAKGEKTELRLGQMFDVFVSGKVAEVKKIRDEVLKDKDGKCPRYKIVRQYRSVVDFHNGGDKKADIVFYQPLHAQTKILNENSKGAYSDKNANIYQWRILLNADEKKTLTFTAETTTEENRCN